MEEKNIIKKQLLAEMSVKLDELLDSTSTMPEDLYELEKTISQMGSTFEKRALEALDEYNRKKSKKKLSKM